MLMNDKEIAMMFYRYKLKFLQCKTRVNRDNLLEDLYQQAYGNYREIILDAYLAVNYPDGGEQDWIDYRTLSRWRNNEFEYNPEIYS